jgi:hypothetical protein
MYSEDWLFKNRKITSIDPNFECPISISKIKKNEWYCKCKICNYNISFKSFEQMYIKNNGFPTKCPICREHWRNNLIIYLNNENKYILKIKKNTFKLKQKMTYNLNIFKEMLSFNNENLEIPLIATNGFIQDINNDLYSLNHDLYSLTPNTKEINNKTNFWNYLFSFYITVIFIIYLLI